MVGDRLDDAQHEAVTHDAGPLLIVAGAGTGKTTVITRRIAWLITQRRARPEQVLALTFTDKAAAEMEERVDQLVPYGYADVEIATLVRLREGGPDELLEVLERAQRERHELERREPAEGPDEQVEDEDGGAEQRRRPPRGAFPVARARSGSTMLRMVIA